MVLCQPKIPTGGTYYKVVDEEQSFDVGFSICYLHPLARVGTLAENLPSLSIALPPDSTKTKIWKGKKKAPKNKLLAGNPVYLTLQDKTFLTDWTLETLQPVLNAIYFLSDSSGSRIKESHV